MRVGRRVSYDDGSRRPFDHVAALHTESNEAVSDVCYFLSNLSMKNSTSDSYFGFAPGYFK